MKIRPIVSTFLWANVIGNSKIYHTIATRLVTTKVNPSSSPVYVVSCASRGLGLEFTRHLLQDDSELKSKPAAIIALCRSLPSNNDHPLMKLKEIHNNLELVQVDLENEESVIKAGDGMKFSFLFKLAIFKISSNI